MLVTTPCERCDMTLQLIYPLLAQIALTFIVLFAMGAVRQRALQAREVEVKDIALSGTAWPDQARQYGNNFSNQFELPVLFYVLILAALHTGATNILTVVLAWVFVLSRVVHAFIHVTSNHVRRRALAYTIGVFALIGIWLVIAVKLATRL